MRGTHLIGTCLRWPGLVSAQFCDKFRQRHGESETEGARVGGGRGGGGREGKCAGGREESVRRRDEERE
jgi:hypothetical protein